jgi:hypothetical protein
MVHQVTPHLIAGVCHATRPSTLARVGTHDRAAHELDRVVRGGFWCHQVFMRAPWLAPVRERQDVRVMFGSWTWSSLEDQGLRRQTKST